MSKKSYTAVKADIPPEQPATAEWAHPKQRVHKGTWHLYVEFPLADVDDAGIKYKSINSSGRWLLSAVRPDKTSHWIFVWDETKGDVNAMESGRTETGAFYLAVPIQEKWWPKADNSA